MDLRASARSGVAWNSLAVSGTALVGLVQIAIAARFLEREDFGLMAMILIVIGFSQNLADLGTANALLHHQQATRRQLESLFWLSLAAGGVLFALVAAGGVGFARLWGQPALAFWLPVSALVFLFGGASQVSITLMRRELRFRALARIELRPPWWASASWQASPSAASASWRSSPGSSGLRASALCSA